MTDSGITMMATHNVRLIILLVVIEIVASYTALNFVGLLTKPQGRVCTALGLAGSAIALLPEPAYNLPIVLVSIAVAVVASGAALFLFDRRISANDERDRLFTLSLDMLCVAGFDGYFKRLNPAWEKTLGFTNEELQSKPYLEFVHPQDREATVAEAQKLTTGVNTFSFENRYLCKDGSYRWLLWDTAPSVEQQLVYAVAHDITDRKQMEAALRESEERFRALSACSPVGIFMTDTQPRCTYINRRCQEICGFTLEESLANGWLQSVHPDDREWVLADWTRCAHAGQECSQEYRFQPQAGIVRWVHARTSPMFSDQGELLGHVGTLEDITERKWAIEALRESEQRFRTLVINIPGVIYRCACDVHWTMEFLSDRIEKLSGYPTSDFIGNHMRSFTSIIHPEDREVVEREVHLAVKKQQPYILEYRIVHADGGIRWVEEHGCGEFSLAGQLLWLDGAIFNITDRKRAQSALQKANDELEIRVEERTTELKSANERLQSEIIERQRAESELRESNRQVINILESITDAFLALNHQWQFTYLNRQAEQLLQRTGEELLGKNIWEEYPDAINISFYREYHKAVSQQVAVAFEEFYPPLNTWFEVRAYPSEDGLSVYFKNINERKRTQSALRQSEQRLARIFETIPDGIVILNHNGQITDANAAAEKILGLTRDDITERVYNDPAWQVKTVDGKPFPEEDLPFVQVMQTGESVWNVEQVIEHTDGTYIIFSVNAAPLLSAAGDFIGMVASMSEITERKRVEEQIKKLNQDLKCRTVELEAANKELEAFSYSVSHDLRAPLRAINGFSRILMGEYAPTLAPEAKRYLLLVQDNAQQMGQLVDDLLAFSRLSRSALKKKLVHPSELVRQALTDLRYEQENRHAEILIGDLPACQADPLLLKQVWVNLLANALKFTRQQDIAKIEVSYQQINGDRVYFVKDNGIGFDMQYAHKLFSVFQRLHRAEEYEGTGVGLAIVQRVIHRHGGRVWVEAEVNKGATFYFTLGEDIHHDRDRSRNLVSGRQPQRCGIDTPLLEKQ